MCLAVVGVYRIYEKRGCQKHRKAACEHTLSLRTLARVYTEYLISYQK